MDQHDQEALARQEALAKQEVLKFLGTTYGELKKLDGNVVGPSSTLGHRSDNVKTELQNFLNANVNPIQQSTSTPPPTPEVPPSQPTPIETVQNTTIPVQEIPTPIPQVSVNDPLQGEFNFDETEKEQLFNLIEKVLTRVDKLHRKVDELSNEVKNSQVTSLPIKKRVKKKTVETKEEK